jgi:sirohydrochlorin cobaltochelatase
MENVKTCKVKKIRMIPFMFVAGDHIINDIMGDKPDKKGVISWKMELQQNGFTVESPKDDFKGLGYYKDINGIFIRQLLKTLQGFN